MNKYHNIHIYQDGYLFDSRAELNHYLLLKVRIYAGEISDLLIHPRYEIIPAIPAHRQRATFYVADFSYREGGREIVADVKGVETTIFRLKRKLFWLHYPDIELRIVEA